MIFATRECMSMQKLIKSKQRKRDYGEVYTPKWLVKDMCDTIPDEIWNDLTATFLEPCCGNGNFLVEIFERKLKLCKDERDGLKALNAIFGIDIQQDNVCESRERLLKIYLDYFPYASNLSVSLAIAILNNRIVCDNALNPQTEIVKSWGITPCKDFIKNREVNNG